MRSRRRRDVLLGLVTVPALQLATDEQGGAARGSETWGALAFPSGGGDRVPAPRRSVEVRDGEELAAALGRAAAGDHIVLADGEYVRPGGFEVARGGGSGAPVVLRPARPGRVMLRDPVMIRADDTCLMALDFPGPDAVIIHGDRNTVLCCRFRNVTGVLLSRGASDNKIGWNSFLDLPYQRDESNNAVRLDPRPGDPQPMTGNHVYRNYFSTKFDERKNDGVCMYVGLSKNRLNGCRRQ